MPGHRVASEATLARAVARHDGAREHFWRVYLGAGLALLAVETVVILGYLLMTPHGRDRLGLEIVAIAMTAAALCVLPFAGRIAAARWRTRFALATVLIACLALSVCAAIDGGIDSTPLALIVLPVVWAGVGLSPRAVAACGAASLLEVIVVGAGDPDVGFPRQHILMLVALVAGAGVLACVSSLNRARLEQKEAELGVELVVLADTDGLTGCLNQRVFEQAVQAEIDRALRHHTRLSLLVLDVDLLKNINDTHGHAYGDSALETIGAVLRGNIRSFDVAARIGGDEFAVILPSVATKGAETTARRISAALDKATAGGVSVSIGVATLDPTCPTAHQLTRDADAAMYRAKANGRHAIETSGPAMGYGGPPRPSGATAPARPEDHARLEDRVRRADRETARTATVLDTLMSTAPIGLAYVDRNFRFVRANATLAAIDGLKVEDILGRTVEDVVPNIWLQVEAFYRRVLATGTPVLNVEVSDTPVITPEERHYWLASYYPVRLAEEIIGVGIVLVDITGRKEWEIRRAAFTHSAVAALAATIEVRDPYTAGHQRAVADIAAAIATELGCDKFETEGIQLAAAIHDIGKIGIPSGILNRPGQLSAIEMDLVRTHSQIGADILAGVDFPWPVREMVAQHHERLDGSGYPRGLKGEEIVLGARIIAVADVVDAMSSHRPYRPAGSVQAGIAVLEAGRGTLFDPAVVDACLRVVRRSMVGPRGPKARSNLQRPKVEVVTALAD